MRARKVISPSPDEKDAQATPNNVIGSHVAVATVTNDRKLKAATTSVRYWCGDKEHSLQKYTLAVTKHACGNLWVLLNF